MADEQAAEAKRLADAQAAVEAQQWALERERQKAREEAERNAAEEQASFIARECPEDQPADDQGDELPAKALFLIPPYFQIVVAVADVFSVPHEVADGWIKHYQNPPLDGAN